jgi:hypothetical protein
MRTILVPNKHVKFSESILALAGWARQELASPMTLDELWSRLQQQKSKHPWLKEANFEKLTYGILMLYSIGELEPSKEDRIQVKSPKK